MPAWDIDPGGVKGIVVKTQGVAAHFEDELKSIGTALEGGAHNGSSQIIADAISGYAEHAKGDITFVVHRTGAAMAAAVKATSAYLRGDLEMAANAQHSATSAPPADDLPGQHRSP